MLKTMHDALEGKPIENQTTQERVHVVNKGRFTKIRPKEDKTAVLLDPR